MVLPQTNGRKYIGKYDANGCKGSWIRQKKQSQREENYNKTLRKAGVPRDKVKHISGHKSTSSIEAYDDDLSDD